MADTPHAPNVEGWQIIAAFVGLLVLVGYLYIQARESTKNGEKISPVEFFNVPGATRTVTPPLSPTPVPARPLLP